MNVNVLHAEASARFEVGHTLLCVRARVQGPFDATTVPAIELRSFQHLFVASGGIGIAAVLPMLKRMALLHAEEANGGPAQGEGAPDRTRVPQSAQKEEKSDGLQCLFYI